MASWRHYVVPFAIFILLTEISKHFPEQAYLFYSLKAVLVGGLLFFWRHIYQELWVKARWRDLLLGVWVGLGVLAFWVGAEPLFPALGQARGFAPQEFGLGPLGTWVVVFFRLAGAVLVVPIMEELFWRSFLMRYLINKNFYEVPLGSYTHFSFWAVAVLFALEHFRIVPGLVAGVAYGGLLCLTKNLRVPILAHAVTNLGLGIYVLLTHQWQFW